MKKIISLASTLIMSIAIFAQNGLATYYKYVNKAELAICDLNYQKASDYYHKAFKVHTPFNRDLYYAFKIDYKYIDDIDRAIYCYHKMAQRDNVDENDLDSLKYRNMWQHAKNIRDTTRIVIDYALQDTLISIRNSDQRIRAERSKGEADDEVVYQTDTINLAKIQKIYKQYENINESTIGYLPGIDIVLRHNIYYGFDPAELLLKEVLNGNFHARSFMRLEDDYKTFGFNDEPYQAYYGINLMHSVIINKTFFVYPPENIKQVNKNRKAIYQSETWDDYLTKMMFAYYNPDSEFKIYFPSHLISGEEVDEQSELERKKEIDEKRVKGKYYLAPTY